MQIVHSLSELVCIQYLELSRHFRALYHVCLEDIQETALHELGYHDFVVGRGRVRQQKHNVRVPATSVTSTRVSLREHPQNNSDTCTIQEHT